MSAHTMRMRNLAAEEGRGAADRMEARLLAQPWPVCDCEVQSIVFRDGCKPGEVIADVVINGELNIRQFASFDAAQAATQALINRAAKTANLCLIAAESAVSDLEAMVARANVYYTSAECRDAFSESDYR